MQNKNSKIKILLALVFSFSLFVLSFSLVSASRDSGVYTYIFYLYLNQGKLTKDRDYKFPFDLAAKEYQVSTVGSSFRAEILSVSNRKLADVPLNLVKNGPKGKIKAEAPYFSNAKTANFYNKSNVMVLAIDLAPGGPVCNENGICDSISGENNQNCPTDCKIVIPSPTPTPTITPATLLQRVFSPTNLIGLLVVIALIILFIYLRKKKQNVPPPQV